MKHPQRELEELVVDAWPARETADLSGWLLRASGGPTRRGNSVAALEQNGARPLEELITETEQWYAGHGRPALFQIGPCVQPKELDQTLASRDYTKEGETAHAVAAAFALSALSRPGSLEVSVRGKPSAEWQAVTAGASRYANDVDSLQGFFKRLGSRCRFATVSDRSGKPLGACLGIASEDRLGVYAMITLPESRRQGAARALLRGLGESALEDGMRDVYLLVEVENLPARALYESCGFRDVYRYHYRVQPVLDPSPT